MPADITNALRRVLNVRNPRRVDVLIEAVSGQGDDAAEALDRRGVEYTEINLRGQSVFEATVQADAIEELAQVSSFLRIDHSPTFSATGAVADPGRGAKTEAGDVRRISLYDATLELNVPDAWEQAGTRGEGVKIGMVDAPIDADHPAINHAVAETAGPQKPSAHGTWVASAMVAQEWESNRGRVRGVAPEADLYAHGAMSEGGGKAADIIEGIEYLLSKRVDVINLSLGGPHSDVLQTAVGRARDNGAVVVSSAGNGGPAIGSVTCPAHHQEVVAVGSTTTQGSPPDFTARGPGWVDAYQKPNVTAYGGGASIGGHDLEVTETILGAAPNQDAKYLVGTSMAAPQAAGIAALSAAANRSSEK